MLCIDSMSCVWENQCESIWIRGIQIFSFTIQIEVNISFQSILPKLMRTRHRHRYTLLKHSSLVSIFLTQTALFRLPWPWPGCVLCVLTLLSPTPGLALSLPSCCADKMEMSSSSIKIWSKSPTLASIWIINHKRNSKPSQKAHRCSEY